MHVDTGWSRAGHCRGHMIWLACSTQLDLSASCGAESPCFRQLRLHREQYSRMELHLLALSLGQHALTSSCSQGPPKPIVGHTKWCTRLCKCKRTRQDWRICVDRLCKHGTEWPCGKPQIQARSDRSRSGAMVPSAQEQQMQLIRQDGFGFWKLQLLCHVSHKVSK